MKGRGSGLGSSFWSLDSQGFMHGPASRYLHGQLPSAKYKQCLSNRREIKGSWYSIQSLLNIQPYLGELAPLHAPCLLPAPRSLLTMPICIECRYPVKTLYTEYSAADDKSTGHGVRLTVCKNCGRFCDKYVEHDFVVLFIDLVLIKPQVSSTLHIDIN